MAAARPHIQGKKEKLLRLIECPICLNELQDPRLLSCRHTLCYTCLKDYTEKGNYSEQLPCPVCRGVTVLYEGGVDNLPKFFFMNELKEVVTEQDDEVEEENQPQSMKGGSASSSGSVCSVEDCGQPAMTYCKDGCQFLCQRCYDDHQSIRITKNHQVFPITKPRKCPYPPCNHHNHQVLDLYCRTCDMPVCTTCSQANHRDHDCCDLDEHADVCKTKLEQLCEDTNELIDVVKQTVDKTKCQVQQAEVDIDDACDNVKSIFKVMHEKLDEEENKMLFDLQDARRRLKKTGDVTIDSQMMTLAGLESLKSCEIKLVDKGTPYDYVTVTDSIKMDLDEHYGQQLPGFMWNCQFVRKDITGEVGLCLSGKVKLTQTEETSGNRKVKEIGKVVLHNHNKSVLGLVVHRGYIYTVHSKEFIVYCFNNQGTLLSKYEHVPFPNHVVQGMCLITDGNKAMLVISDFTDKSLVWVGIYDDFVMRHHHTQHLDYKPCGSYSDRGDLLVCGADHKIHRYTAEGQAVGVITLPDDVMPWCLTRAIDSVHLVITDYVNKQIVIINKEGQVKAQYKNNIHGVKLGQPCGIIKDFIGRVLISDQSEMQVLMLSSDCKEARQLLRKQHVISPVSLCLDSENHRMYVSDTDQDNKNHLLIYDYFSDHKFTDVISKYNLIVQL